EDGPVLAAVPFVPVFQEGMAEGLGQVHFPLLIALPVADDEPALAFADLHVRPDERGQLGDAEAGFEPGPDQEDVPGDVLAPAVAPDRFGERLSFVRLEGFGPGSLVLAAGLGRVEPDPMALVASPGEELADGRQLAVDRRQLGGPGIAVLVLATAL